MIITRFAPSPTGLLHVGNLRTALINYLFTKKNNGKFMLRIDDTDNLRSKKEYEEQIIEDLKWAGLNWDIFARQSERLARYEEVKNQLISIGKLYPCFESQEELEIKRKLQLSRSQAPIYDRGSLKLSKEEIDDKIKSGKKPHYRFLIDQNEDVIWQDLVREEVKFLGKNLSDPILIREDGSMTYILTSVIDDIDFGITHIIRGEDHVSNTAIQVQIFKILKENIPSFAHLSLIKGEEAKISKREGGYDIKNLRQESIEAMSINSLFARLGSAMSIEPKLSIDELVKDFDLSTFSKSPATYSFDDLLKLNHKIVSQLSFEVVKFRVKEITEKNKMEEIDENFWNSVRSNIDKLSDIEDWILICLGELLPIIENHELLETAASILPEGKWDENTWSSWTKDISLKTGLKGKELFMPIRKALTSMDHGPELKFLLPLIGYDKVKLRLLGQRA